MSDLTLFFMKLEILKAAFLLVGGVLLLGVGAWFAAAHADLARNGGRAPGVIIDFDVRSVRGTKMYHPIVRFRPADAADVQFTERAGLWRSLFEIGESVKVLYAQEDPSKAKIDSFWTLWFLPLCMLLFGVACLVAGRYSFPKSK